MRRASPYVSRPSCWAHESDRPDNSSFRVVGYSEVIQFDGLSAFRPYGRDLVTFFNSTGWAFLVNLTRNSLFQSIVSAAIAQP